MGEGAPDVVVDIAKEHEFRATEKVLLDPPRVQQKSLTLLITVAAYVAVSLVNGGNQSLLRLAIIVGVLFVHELGHAAGMLLFGYTDVRIFFIPLLGAAAAGRRRGVARWKHGVVLLLGPVPGLIAGAVMFALGVDGVARTIALMLMIINGFNLIPVAPFDGGQLFQLLWFSRHRRLEIGFLVVAGLALIAGAVELKSWVFGLLGYFVLLSVPVRAKVLAAGQRLRALELPTDPAALDEPQRRRMFDDMWSWMPQQWHGKPRIQAATLENMLELATQKPPTARLTAALFAAWLAAAGIAAAGIALAGVVASVAPPPARWAVYQHRGPDFAIELPAPPRIDDRAITVSRGRHREYGVLWAPHGRPAKDFIATMVTGMHATVTRVITSTDTEAEAVFRTELGTFHVRVLVAGQFDLIVNAIAPDDEPESDRVVRSLHPL